MARKRQLTGKKLQTGQEVAEWLMAAIDAHGLAKAVSVCVEFEFKQPRLPTILKTPPKAHPNAPEGGFMTGKKCNELAALLLEARDALPAITKASVGLHNVDLSLARRIKSALEPWRIQDSQPDKSEIEGVQNGS